MSSLMFSAWFMCYVFHLYTEACLSFLTGELKGQRLFLICKKHTSENGVYCEGPNEWPNSKRESLSQ